MSAALVSPEDEPAFAVHPWQVQEDELVLDRLGQAESVFALSNGHVGLRGNLDEGEPHVLPGTYLNSVYELRPLPYAEAGYGYPESGQTIINVTNGKLIRLLVDDEPFDIRYGELDRHVRTLDLRAGTLRREAEWTSPAGKSVRITSTRLVSFSHRSVAAIEYIVEPVDESVRLVLQSELVANEDLPTPRGDPRVSAALDHALEPEEHQATGTSLLLIHRTQRSALRLAAICDHDVEGPRDTETMSQSFDDIGRVTILTELQPGQRLRVVKYLAYGWSSERSLPAIRDQVVAAMSAARRIGWDGLVADQRKYLDEFWQRADVEVDGDPEIQQAVRFALFQVLSAGARAERRGIPAKGLTGSGYDGHTFWDMDTYTLPVLTYALPRAAGHALEWRLAIMPQAQERATQLGLAGAAFPWRTIRGHECSAYWPAGTAAFHVNADIADAAIRYINATGDREWEAATGLPLLVGTARLWLSLGHHDRDGTFRIDGVTGPDEYTAVVDNNVFTNLMARRNLLGAVAAVGRHPEQAERWKVSHSEVDGWRHAATAMYVPYDEELGVHPQSSGFLNHDRWAFEQTSSEHYPLLLHYPYFDLYRKQVVKQADLVLALYKIGDAFTAEQKERDFAYYEGLTVRDSSLSACIQAIVAAETGHTDLAYDYLGEASLVDLHNLSHNTSDGLHIASLAGTWLTLVAGFGGMRDHGEVLEFRPRLPADLSRLAFRMAWRGSCLKVQVDHDQVVYEVLDGPPVTLQHEDERVEVSQQAKVVRPAVESPAKERPSQPDGREPARRGGRRH